MKFNPNQRYTRWSIRRLSVGVASVVVASGFFVLVGQPSSARADVVNPTPAQVVSNDASVSEKGDLSAEVLNKAVDVDLSSEQSIPTPQASVDTTSSSEKADATAKDPEVAPKEEVQAQPDSKKQTEDAVKPVEGSESTVSGQDREASEAQPATTPAEVQKGVADNTKDTVDVPASYLDKANFPGPFTAGVNQVIPYEAFGGDGMLTRLILKASDKAPWSDNGMDKNPALLPLEGLAKGQYFYEVDLNGNTVGKDGQALLEQLRANGTHTYSATIKVYGSKDGKPDLTNLIATRQVTIQLRGKEMATIPSQQGQMNTKPSETGSTGTTDGMMGTNHHMSDMKVDQPASGPMANMMKKDVKAMLPNTGEAQTATAGLGILGLALAGFVGFLGWKTKRED